MNNINLFAYTNELNQFLNEATRLKNINFNDDDNITLRERGVARGVYKDNDTSSGSIDGEASTMNVDFNTPVQQTKQNTNDTPPQEQPQEQPQENPQEQPQTEPQSEPQNEPQEQPQEQQIEDNSAELEKLQISYKKIINLQKKFAAFKKQCENSELTVEDVIKSAQGGGQESASNVSQESAPTSGPEATPTAGQSPTPSTNG